MSKEIDLHQTTDASEWAREFKRLFPDSDESLMLTWFANAIMVGHDAAKRIDGDTQTFFAIKRDEEPRYIGFDSDEDGENVPYFSAFYKSDLYIDKDEAEGDLKAAKEDGWTGLNTARIVKVRVEEVDE